MVFWIGCNVFFWIESIGLGVNLSDDILEFLGDWCVGI